MRPIRLRCAVLLFLVSTAVAPLLGQGAPITGSANVRLAPPSFTVQPGLPFELLLQVDLTGVTGRGPSGATVPAVLGSYNITVTFNPALLTFEGVSGGTSTGFTSPPAATPRATANAQGQFTVSASQTSASAPTGMVTVAFILFVPLNNGTATVSPISGTLSSANQGNNAGPVSIPFGTSPAVITISDTGTAAPVITSLNPAEAAAGGPAFVLTVNGTNFLPGSVVLWNDEARPTTVLSAQRVTADIPAADIANTGTATVVIENPGGTFSNSLDFEITSAPATPPTLSSLSPSSAVAGGLAFTLTVDGSDFVSGSVVNWNGSPRATTFVSSTRLTTLILPADIGTPGTASVTVVNPSGGGTSNALPFTITEPAQNPVPEIISISPQTATAGGFGFTLAITGTGFVPGAVVRWNGAARATTFVSSTQLTASIPNVDIATPGTATVTVVNPGPGGGASGSVSFLVTAAPPIVLISLSPSSVGAGSGGLDVLLTGSGFTPQSQGSFDNAPRPTAFISPTQLRITLSAADLAVPRTATISVAGGGSVSNALSFTVTEPGTMPPVITAVSPGSVPAGGASVTLSIFGSHFISGSVVQVNGAPRPTTFISSSRIDVTLSAADIAGGGFLTLTVLNPGALPVTSNAFPFPITGPGGLLADFTYSPSLPRAGEPVFFTDRSLGPVASRLWNFGDGVTSTEANPAHAFASSGTFNVTLTVSSGGATSSRTQAVFVGASSALTTRLLLPSVAHTIGVGGTLFRSEVTIFNSGSETANLALSFIPQAGPAQSRTVSLPAGRSLSWGSILAELFTGASGSGMLLIEATGAAAPPQIEVASRLFASGPAGTFGQFIGAQRSLPLASLLTGLQSNPDFRTNIGLVNQSEHFVNAILELTNSTGEVIGTTSIGMLPGSTRQNALIEFFPHLQGQPLSDLSLHVQAGMPDALSVFASVLDNRTQDPIFIPGSGAPSARLIVPVVARTEGLAGTFWRSDLSLWNPTTATMILDLRFLPANNDNRNPTARRSVTLFPGHSTTIADVLTFLGAGNGSGALEIIATGPPTGPVVASRTYTTRAGAQGTFGQFVPARPATAFSSGTVITGLRSDGSFRTNVGFANSGDEAVSIQVTLIDSAGTQRGQATVNLAPRGQTQVSLGQLFPSLPAQSLGAFTLRAQASGPTMLMYASTIDNSSGDPIYNDGR